MPVTEPLLPHEELDLKDDTPEELKGVEDDSPLPEEDPLLAPDDSSSPEEGYYMSYSCTDKRSGEHYSRCTYPYTQHFCWLNSRPPKEVWCDPYEVEPTGKERQCCLLDSLDTIPP